MENSGLMEEIHEFYRQEFMPIPGPFDYSGVVLVEGRLKECTITVDLFNCRFGISGLDCQEYAAHQIPDKVATKAERVGHQLLQQILGYVPTKSVYVLRTEPGGIRC